MCLLNCEKERERERELERERDNYIKRRRETEKGRHKDRNKDSERGTNREKHTHGVREKEKCYLDRIIQNERRKDKKETELEKQIQKESIQYNNNEVSLTRPLSALKKTKYR